MPTIACLEVIHFQIKMEQMKGINTIQNKCLSAFLSLMLLGDICRKPLIELTKLAKVSCEVFSYGVNPDPFLNLRSSKMNQMKGIDTTKQEMPGSNIFIYVGGRYLRKPLI